MYTGTKTRVSNMVFGKESKGERDRNLIVLKSDAQKKDEASKSDKVICSHTIMLELCRTIPEVGTAVLLDEMAKFSKLDFHNYGTFSPRDVEKIVTTLSPSMFSTLSPYTEKEVQVAQLFAKQANTPSSITRLSQLALSLYEQARALKNNEELISKLEFVLSVY